MKYYALAIDGPAGAGKSTVAKMLAARLHYTYIDTGAMYRATTYKALKLKVDITNPDSFQFLEDTEMTFVDGVLFMDGLDVTQKIRTNQVSNNVSIVASHIPVRNKLVEIQQSISHTTNVVMDGRDIGTVVLPHADLKIYMTATVEERARRRHEENLSIGIESNYESLMKEIQRRDKIDSSRAYNPLKQAQDAIYLDTSSLDIEEVADKIYLLFQLIIDRKDETHGTI
ncbi:MAG: (d)CMP kinase [Candidatus Izemoplasmatales bacterium]|nr:(d)CMP kinase [bacterium]MDZ4195689.1 (d)CMP kinase [Candidatus Izemoplasmatales bacterium]